MSDRGESASEVDRIREVYDGYDVYAATRWARGNAGNQIMVRERSQVLANMLRSAGKFPPQGSKVLDVGCGEGELLGLFASWGVRHEDCYGVDLLDARIETAKMKFPAMNFAVANAERLDFPDGTFDIVALFTVFSSILSGEMSANLANEVQRLLRPRGCVVIYDFRVPNPINRNTRPIWRGELRRLFPSFRISSRSVTVLPPLARRLGRLTRGVYPALAMMPWLRTHNMSVAQAPLGSSADNC